MIQSAIQLAILFSLTACDGQPHPEKQPANAPDPTLQLPPQWKSYWYAGRAELNHYDLTQMRYGEPRQGEAILVFVTEDFLTDAQVKKESGNAPSVSVLKLNYLKKFITGIYDYSIMWSVFTPVEMHTHPATLKVSFSSQDWCGQVYSQMNLRKQKLNYTGFSYFQSEGDRDTTLDATYVEEDIWTRMRLEPQMLPLKKFDMVPALEFLRLHHKPLKAYTAEAILTLQVNEKGSDLPEFYIYTLRYPELKRELKISIESSFPYKILGWYETINYDDPAARETTSATLTKTLQKPYWELNHNTNQPLRDSLDIKYHFGR